MRFDLTVNEFTRDLFIKKKLLVYDANTWRPYCHVNDFAYLIVKVLESEKSKVNFQIFPEIYSLVDFLPEGNHVWWTS